MQIEASLDEEVRSLGIIERAAFEMKKYSDLRSLDTGNYYAINLEWSSTWIKFLHKKTSIPGPINNRNLYKQYFLEKKEMVLNKDYFLVA